MDEKNKKLHALNEDITETMLSVFEKDLLVSYEERMALAGWFRAASFDGVFGVDISDALMKIGGIIEWLHTLGKIDEEQEEELWMLLNRVEGGKEEGRTGSRPWW